MNEEYSMEFTKEDELLDCIATLEKENAELNYKLDNLTKVAIVRLVNWQKLEKENAELKNKLEHRNCLDCSNHSSKLRMRTLELEKECTKAKELLKQFLEAKNGEDTYKAEWEAEQFLKESEQ